MEIKAHGTGYKLTYNGRWQSDDDNPIGEHIANHLNEDLAQWGGPYEYMPNELFAIAERAEMVAPITIDHIDKIQYTEADKGKVF